jgi:hypothetical protein
MELKTSEDHAYNIKPSFGLQLRFKPLKSSTSWNFLLGLNYSGNNLRGNFDNNLFYYSSTKTYQIYTKYSILRIPLTIDYTFPKAKLQPFLSVSYVNVILLNSKFAAYKVYNNTLWPENAYLRKYQYGFSLGLGLKFNLKNDTYIFIKNEFEYRIPSANLHYVLDNIRCKAWLINLGYGFSIK